MGKPPYLELFSLSDDQFAQLKTETFSDKDLKLAITAANKAKTVLSGDCYTELIAVVEEEIRRKVEKLTFIQYARMQVTGNWTDVGQERMVLSLTRLFQKIPYDQPISYEDLASTKKLLKSKSQPFLELDEKEFDELEDNLTVSFGRKQYDFSEYKKINNFLELINSRCRVIMGQLELYSSIIFGEAVVSDYSDFKVYSFGKEIIHTPAIITSIAAMIKEKEIIIREASAETIFFNKWADALQQVRDISLVDKIKNPAENVSLAIKIRALLSYGIVDQDSLQKKKKLFIEEILEGLLWHEIGHGITLNHFFSNEQVCLDEALSVFGETSSSVAKELLADWTIASKDVFGPLWFMLSASKKKCNRMLMVYLSDNWFLTANDDFFKNHTELLLGSIMDYFNLSKSEVDQAALFQALPIFYKKELKTYRKQLDEIMSLLKEHLYSFDDKKISFSELLGKYEQKFKKHLRSYSAREKKSYILAQLLMDLEHTNHKLKRQVSTILENKNNVYHQELIGEYSSTSERLFAQMEKGGFMLKSTPSLAVVDSSLLKKVRSQIDQVLVEKKELEISTIVGNMDLRKFFTHLFYLAGYAKNEALDDDAFRRAFNELSFAMDSFGSFRDSSIIDYDKLFSLFFLANLRHSPNSLFLGN